MPAIIMYSSPYVERNDVDIISLSGSFDEYFWPFHYWKLKLRHSVHNVYSIHIIITQVGIYIILWQN